MSDVMGEIAAERKRQDKKWGEQNHPFDRPDSWWVGKSGERAAARRAEEHEIASATRAKWLCQLHAGRGDIDWWDILIEEVAEAMESAHDPAAMRAELVQTAAVVLAMIECIDRSEVSRG